MFIYVRKRDFSGFILCKVVLNCSTSAIPLANVIKCGPITDYLDFIEYHMQSKKLIKNTTLYLV